jgi:hypothetical protein
VGIEEIEDFLGIFFDSGGVAIPVIEAHVFFEGRDLKVVFHVNSQIVGRAVQSFKNSSKFKVQGFNAVQWTGF